MTRNMFAECIIKGLSLLFGFAIGFLVLDALHRQIEPQVLAWRGYEAIGGEDLFYVISFIVVTHVIYKIFFIICKEFSNLYYF